MAILARERADAGSAVARAQVGQAMPKLRTEAFLGSLSLDGMLIGGLFLAASLTPSLIPRDYIMQGALAGVSLALGYGIGTRIDALWRYLELPVPGAALEPAVELGRGGGGGGDRARGAVAIGGMAELDPRADGHAPGRLGPSVRGRAGRAGGLCRAAGDLAALPVSGRAFRPLVRQVRAGTRCADSRHRRRRARSSCCCSTDSCCGDS